MQKHAIAEKKLPFEFKNLVTDVVYEATVVSNNQITGRPVVYRPCQWPIQDRV